MANNTTRTTFDSDFVHQLLRSAEIDRVRATPQETEWEIMAVIKDTSTRGSDVTIFVLAIITLTPNRTDARIEISRRGGTKPLDLVGKASAGTFIASLENALREAK